MAIHNNPPASASYAQPAQPPNQTSNVHSVQTVNNQQAGGKKKKHKKKKGNIGQGGHTTTNNNNNTVGGNKGKKKLKYPCKLCKDDHLTHQCPNMEVYL